MKMWWSISLCFYLALTYFLCFDQSATD